MKRLPNILLLCYWKTKTRLDKHSFHLCKGFSSLTLSYILIPVLFSFYTNHFVHHFSFSLPPHFPPLIFPSFSASECIISTFTSNDRRAGSSYSIVEYSLSWDLCKPTQQHDKSEIVQDKTSTRSDRWEFCSKHNLVLNLQGLFWVF